MNKSEASGKFDEIKGKMKQGVGEAIGDDSMANSGAMDQVKGNAKEAWGRAKDAANSAGHTSYENDRTYPADERMREDKHNLRDKVTSMAKDAKEAVTDRADDFKRKRSA
jgi:uncharacterized protein YjbJ (UPF0337 family)